MASTQENGSPWQDDRWAEHHAEVVRYASHLLHGDTHTAEDIAQETAMRLWQHPDVERCGRPLRPWLRTVARNIVVDRHRRSRARLLEVDLDAVDGNGYERRLPRANAAEDAALAEVESASTIEDLLSPLSPRHRDAVVAVYVQDRAISDAARRLGIPEGTVKSRCHTAVRQMRVHVVGDDGDGLAGPRAMPTTRGTGARRRDARALPDRAGEDGRRGSARDG